MAQQLDPTVQIIRQLMGYPQESKAPGAFDFMTGMAPGVSDIRDIIEVVTNKDVLTQQPLDEGGRILQYLAAALPFVSGGLMRMMGGAGKAGRGIPKTVRRIEEKGAAVSGVDKPHGLYTSPSGIRSPHEELGGLSKEFKVNSKANILEVDASDLVRTNRGLVGQSAGIAALRRLVGEDEFMRLSGLRGEELVAEAKRLYPDVEWKRYTDQQEILEGLAGKVARDKGYDAIWAMDKQAPEFDEFVGLTNKAFQEDILDLTPEMEVKKPSKVRQPATRMPQKTTKQSLKTYQQQAETQHIMDIAKELSGNKPNVRVRISDIVSKSGLPKQRTQAILKDIQQRGEAVLMHLDDPRERLPLDEESAIDILGNKRHIVYFKNYKAK